MRLLRNRGFVLLWLGQFLGIMADWGLRTMVLIWVYKLTASGTAVALVGLAEALPLLLLATVAGVFVDRWSRAYTMAGAVAARAVLLLPLLVVTSRQGLPVILVVTVLINGASQFFMPAASAAVPSVVGRDQAGAANSLLQLINGGVAVIGPGTAAALFAALGPHGAVLTLGALYIVAAPVLALVPAPRPEQSTASPSVAREMVDGLRYVRRSPLLMSLIAIAFVALLGFGALSIIDVVFVSRALHLRSETVGVLLSSSGIGEAAGGVVMWLLSAWAATRYHRLLGASVLAMGLLFVAYAAAPTLLAAVIALFLVGATFPPLLVSYMTLIQLETDDAFLGRVMSLVNTGMAVAMIVSIAAGGVLTDAFGVRRVIVMGAVLLSASGILSLLAIQATPKARGMRPSLQPE